LKSQNFHNRKVNDLRKSIKKRTSAWKAGQKQILMGGKSVLPDLPIILKKNKQYSNTLRIRKRILKI